MNGHSRRDRKSGYARVAGPSRSPLLMLPIRLRFSGQEKNQELLLPSASDCAWGRAIAKHQRPRLDDEPLAGFNQSAGPSTYPRRISVRTTRATAARIIDVGAGQSSLVDDLLARGYRNLHVLDLSSTALAAARARRLRTSWKRTRRFICTSLRRTPHGSTKWSCGSARLNATLSSGASSLRCPT